MKNIITGLTLAVALCAFAQTAMAQTAEMAAPYPDPQCKQPDLASIKPPASNNDGAAVSIYNAKVKTFNREASTYNECINAYVDNSNLELKRIHDQAAADQKRLADNANAAMKDVQDKMQKALADAHAISAARENGSAKSR